MQRLRSILALCRAGGLPTVWSNCLAGWWLGGGGNEAKQPFLFIGASLLYLGAAFLHDAFDVHHDRQQRRVRPIPAGAIRARTAWQWGLGFTVAGALAMIFVGVTTGALALALVFFSVLFNSFHRVIGFAPVLQGLVRFLLYLVGASVAERGVTGWSIWCGLALGVYVTGLGFFAARWGAAGKVDRTPLLLLAVPVLLAFIMDVDGYREPGLLLSAVLVLWTLRCLRQALWSSEPSLPKTVGGITAGIVFVDWLAACPATLMTPAGVDLRVISGCFLAFFGAALVLQRLTPEA